VTADVSIEQTATSQDALRARVLANFERYDAHVVRAEELLAAGDALSAAAWAKMAACIAVETHCGIFSSTRLERLLTTIGKASEPASKPRPAPTAVRRVLHVSTQVYPVGGHSKMLRLWIENDPGRQHSLALTNQQIPVPADLMAAVVGQGGKVHSRLNRGPGDLMTVVSKLRRIARNYDLIVLHISYDDVVPPIAFAQTDRYPPVLFLNHADHLFWIGSAISQVVGGMRAAAMDLAVRRRGIAAERSVLVPILVNPTERRNSRAEAKKALGVADDEVLLISVARHQKYRSLDGAPYAAVHAEVLREHPKARLLVVGAGDQPDWREAVDSVGGRIEALSARDPKPYFEAADVYLDSYPFCSATSMMEAAGYGLPCITRFVLPAGARICGMDHPGLFGPLIEVDNNEDYKARLSELIGDAGLRADIGAAMLDSVARSNVAPGWCTFMEAAYAQAIALPRPDGHLVFPEQDVEQPSCGEPDLRIEEIYGYTRPRHQLVKEHLGQLGLRERLRVWRGVGRERGFIGPKDAFRLLFPEWMHTIRYYGI
jgi:hypothetical protein